MAKTITICASGAFAAQAYELKAQLEEKGFRILVFRDKVKLNGEELKVDHFNELRKQRLTSEMLALKKQLMDEHIKNIEQSDAVLILNLDKNGISGYIGGNTFMEMAIAYYLGKPIFLWKQPSPALPYYEEVMAMNPTIIDGNVGRLKKESSRVIS